MTISIIIPIYNSDKYLATCINSVLKQTFSDFELLLINDGSTDGSEEICTEYEKKDSRIKVYHKDNGGVSSARNLGLKKARGKWVCFMDSDDSAQKNYLFDLLVAVESEQTDLVIQGFKSIDREKEREIAFGNSFIKADEYKILFEEKEIFKYGYPFSKLFKKEIITRSDILFPEDYSFAEDLSFFLNYLSKCRFVNFQEKYNYNYVSQPNSLSKTVKKPTEYFNRYIDYKNIIKQNFHEVFSEVYGSNVYFKEFTRSIGGAVFYYIQSLYLNKEFQKKERISHLKKLKENDLIVMRNFRTHLNHPMYKLGFSLLIKKQYFLGDFILKTFMK